MYINSRDSNWQEGVGWLLQINCRWREKLELALGIISGGTVALPDRSVHCAFLTLSFLCSRLYGLYEFVSIEQVIFPFFFFF